MSRYTTFILLLALVDATHAASVDFVRDVRPLLEKHCYSCHGSTKQKSDLRLDIRSQAFAGGELYGASIITGNANESPLYQFMADEEADLRMPPEGDRLAENELEVFRNWINGGAVWPDGVDPVLPDQPDEHWAFQPLSKAKPPELRTQSWGQNAIDQFILARLEVAGLTPAPTADRVTWLRRVSFDLTGLPPSLTHVEDFLNDHSDQAYERVVDRLLASPRYGERQAQHWLDVVRYADTHGFEVNTERPNAWPYRDYVIDAFNQNTPYDQFIREQIVGDALEKDAATGFLVTASVLLPGQIGKDEPSKRLARQDSIDEIVVNIGQTFLGLSIGCARCHNHKFDPISQKDYYSMQAFVSGVEYGERPVKNERAEQEVQRIRAQLAPVETQLAEFVPPAMSETERPRINAQANIERFAPVTTSRLRFTILKTNSLEPCLDELEVFDTDGRNVSLASRGTTTTASGSRTQPNRHELRFVNDGQYGNSRSWMSSESGKGWVELKFTKAHAINRVAWGRDREGKYKDRLATEYRIEVTDESGQWKLVADSSDRQSFKQDAMPEPVELAGLDDDQLNTVQKLVSRQKQLYSKLAGFRDGGQPIFAGKFRNPDAIHRLRRGDPEQPLEAVVPAVLSVLDSVALEDDSPEQQRRKTLADWIASPVNPLTARVMVNRIWQSHFGVGLLDTPNDFGRNGSAPSHPELLEWIADEFVRSGWSIKHMHRLIVLSATYRQSSQTNPEGIARDAGVRLLWRYPSRRLEGEAIRDSILAVSGQLNLKTGGPGFNLFDKRGGLTGFKPVESFSGEGLRRMIYAHKVRRERDGVFGAFDCPDAGQSTPRRRESTTPVQALNLFNSRFVLDQAEAMAARVHKLAGDNIDQQIQHAYRLALSRNPSNDELQAVTPTVREFGLPVLCRALFNCNEFLFLP